MKDDVLRLKLSVSAVERLLFRLILLEGRVRLESSILEKSRTTRGLGCSGLDMVAANSVADIELAGRYRLLLVEVG